MKAARLIGCSAAAVLLKRRELGIAACQAKKPVDWTDEMKALLGTMTDREVAERLSLTLDKVRKARYRFGITGARPGRRKATR